jgi:hypothetical protein
VRCRRFGKRESLCGIRVSLAQCAQLTLTPDFVWDRDFGSGCASRVAMMHPADHRESDDLPHVGFSLAIRRMSVRISASIGGRPVLFRLFQVQ